jgi:2'-5' RNA ligase
MRVFIAIPLNTETHDELSALQDKLRNASADVKWTQPDCIHLTLKFLGEVDEKKLEAVKSALLETAKKHSSFAIQLSHVGAFPRLSYPRVIWIGIDEGQKESKALQCDIEEALENLSFKKENREFTPHLTLGRLRSNNNKQRLIELLGKEKDFASNSKVPVKKIVLFQSTLTPKGPIYTVLSEFPLA